MKRHLNHVIWLTAISLALLSSGCGDLRLAPSEGQKQNAWLHNRTTEMAAEAAKAEEVSPTLQALTKLSEVQSRAFTSHYGLPKEYPPAETPDDVLGQSNWTLARMALEDSAKRPDPWQAADTALEIGIGISALVGGVYGTRAVRFLKEARAKSKALKEIIQGNEQFKQNSNGHAKAFKTAHAHQSPETRQLVAGMKA